MTAITSVILKVASRCNLNCSYCYMYNLVDQSYLVQPRTVDFSTIDNTFQWIDQHCRTHGLSSFRLILHGGEPLLAGKEKIRYIGERAKGFRRAGGVHISVSLLTNGILLDEEWLATFEHSDIGFSISIDGPTMYHDRFRIHHDGSGSHKQVEHWIKFLIANPSLCPTFGKSALCVIHPDMDGRLLVKYFHDLGLKKIDFLFPDQNHDHGSDAYPKPTQGNIYAKVLIDAYKEWRQIDDSSFKIRKFELLIFSLLGIPVALDSIGKGPIKVFTIETDGGIEPVDSMKICGDNFTKSGYNINSIEDIDIESIDLIRLGLDKDSFVDKSCISCRYFDMCGGGYLPHRFQNGNFTKTVYCSDMVAMCEFIENDIELVFDRALETFT